jgi:hypothetical protein
MRYAGLLSVGEDTWWEVKEGRRGSLESQFTMNTKVLLYMLSNRKQRNSGKRLHSVIGIV